LRGSKRSAPTTPLDDQVSPGDSRRRQALDQGGKTRTPQLILEDGCGVLKQQTRKADAMSSTSLAPEKSTRSAKRPRDMHAPRLPMGGLPRKVPAGKFLWHNHVQRCVGMGHGVNGLRCWNGFLPVDYRKFERCHCGWVDLPHYKIRGLGSGKCVSPEEIFSSELIKLAEANRNAR
jgi:hypothetical protein